jgi:hypothetical protein
MAHHFRPDPARWRANLNQAAFTVEEEGRQPVTLYWLARKNETSKYQLPTPNSAP